MSAVISAVSMIQPNDVASHLLTNPMILDSDVKKIFANFEWVVVILNNFLILATDPMDGYAKLKFSKSWIRCMEVNFFGYQWSHKGSKLTDDRKTAIMKMQLRLEIYVERCVWLLAVWCSFRRLCQTIPTRPSILVI